MDCTSTWQNLLNVTKWASLCWKNNGYTNVTFSIPMLVRAGGSLKLGAQGAYDSYFTQIGQILINNGLGSTTLRLGWEHSGSWYIWGAQKDPSDFILYWQHLVKLFRGLPGANFKFNWNTSLGWMNVLQPNVYPGDQYVEFVGVDAYNIDYNPKDTTPAARWKTLTTESYGLNWYVTFATQHNKPLSVPEWGTGNGNAGHAGGDDPYYVQQMVNWMAANNVIYFNWFDCCGRNAGFDSTFAVMPKSAAVFKQAYGPQ